MSYERILTASIVALEGHGKTDFLKSLPKPAAVFHIDSNTEEAFEAAFESGEIERDDFKLFKVDYPQTIFGSKDNIQDDAEKIWEDQVISPLKDVLEDSQIRSIGIDTCSEFYETKLIADTGKSVQLMPEQRTKSNYLFKGFLSALKRSNKHTVLLHRAGPVYTEVTKETNRGTQTTRERLEGVYQREGFSKVGFHVNVEAYLFHHPVRSENVSSQFGMRVSKCTARASLVTARYDTKEFWTLDDPAWWWGREKLDNGKRVRRVSFPYLATKVYPDTRLKDWE